MNKELLIILERTITLLRNKSTEDEVRAVLEMILNGMMKNGTLTEEAIALNKHMTDEENKPRIIV